MAFFEDLGRTLTKVGEVTAQKTKEVAEFTKINAKILELQNKLDKAYAEVGKKYMLAHPANEEEELQGVVEAAYRLEDELMELRNQLQDLKGTMKCEVCGTKCSTDAIFCSNCGAELKKEKVVVDSDATEFEADDIEDVFE